MRGWLRTRKKNRPCAKIEKFEGRYPSAPSINASSSLITMLSEKNVLIAKTTLKFDDFPSYEARSASSFLPDRVSLADRKVTPLSKTVVLAAMFS